MGSIRIDVIMTPAEAARRGLTSTVTFPRGNLAPQGSVIKSTAIDPTRRRCRRRLSQDRTGARLHHRAGGDGRDQGMATIQAGDVIVLICRGPMGAGMEEIYQVTSALKHLAFGKHVAVMTDARFSGVSTGACIGHVGPEALAGGPIGKMLDGDVIRIVIDREKWKAPSIWSEPMERPTTNNGERRMLVERQSRPDLARGPEFA